MQNSVSYEHFFPHFEIFTLIPSVHLQCSKKILKQEPLQSGAKYISWQKLWKSVVHLVPYIYGVCTVAFTNHKSISAEKIDMDKISRHVYTNIEGSIECTWSDCSKYHTSRRILSSPENIASSCWQQQQNVVHTHTHITLHISLYIYIHMKDAHFAQCTYRMLQSVHHRFGSSWP